MKVDLLPYTEIDGIPTMTNSFIEGLYRRMQEDGTADTVFYDGTVRDAAGFLRKMRYENIALYAVYADRELAGVLWLNGFEGRFARCHWCVFSPYWGKGSVEIGKASLRQILALTEGGGRHLYDMLLGVLPSSNERAVAYCLKCGGKRAGAVPNLVYMDGKSAEGTIIYYTREVSDEGV